MPNAECQKHGLLAFAICHLVFGPFAHDPRESGWNRRRDEEGRASPQHQAARRPSDRSGRQRGRRLPRRGRHRGRRIRRDRPHRERQLRPHGLGLEGLPGRRRHRRHRRYRRGQGITCSWPASSARWFPP